MVSAPFLAYLTLTPDPSICQAGSKFECNQLKDYWCHHTPQWKVDERVVHPSWAWIVFLTQWIPRNCRCIVWFQTHHRLNREVVPKLHWCPGISNWNPRAEGAQTWVGRLSCFYVKSSKNGRFDHLSHSPFWHFWRCCCCTYLNDALSGGPSGVSILFPLFCLHWATAGVQKTRPGRLGFWAQDFWLVGINPMRLYEDVINAINSNIVDLLIKRMIKQEKCFNKFHVVIWNPSATLRRISHLNIYWIPSAPLIILDKLNHVTCVLLTVVLVRPAGLWV